MRRAPGGVRRVSLYASAAWIAFATASLAQALDEGAEAATSSAARPALVRASIDEILSAEEFSRVPTIGDRVREWLGDLFSRLLPDIEKSTAETIAAVVVWTVLIVAAILVLWSIVRIVRSGLARKAAAVAAPDPVVLRARRVSELRARAREANARGEYVLALRLEFTALVVGLGERGDLEYRDAFTNRELLERGRPGPGAEAVLRPLVPGLDRKSFGGEAATAADFADLAALCDRLLAGARA